MVRSLRWQIELLQQGPKLHFPVFDPAEPSVLNVLSPGKSTELFVEEMADGLGVIPKFSYSAYKIAVIAACRLGENMATCMELIYYQRKGH